MCDQQNLRSACAYAQSDQSFCLSLEYSLTVKLLTEVSKLKGCCAGSSVKFSYCWKSHGTALSFISRRGSAISSALEWGSGFIHNLIKSLFDL